MTDAGLQDGANPYWPDAPAQKIVTRDDVVHAKPRPA
jgi:hypothetical protein